MSQVKKVIITTSKEEESDDRDDLEVQFEIEKKMYRVELQQAVEQFRASLIKHNGNLPQLELQMVELNNLIGQWLTSLSELNKKLNQALARDNEQRLKLKTQINGLPATPKQKQKLHDLLDKEGELVKRQVDACKELQQDLLQATKLTDPVQKRQATTKATDKFVATKKQVKQELEENKAAVKECCQEITKNSKNPAEKQKTEQWLQSKDSAKGNIVDLFDLPKINLVTERIKQLSSLSPKELNNKPDISKNSAYRR